MVLFTLCPVFCINCFKAEIEEELRGKKWLLDYAFDIGSDASQFRLSEAAIIWPIYIELSSGDAAVPVWHTGF